MILPSGSARRYFDPALETADRHVLREHQWQRLTSLVRQIWPTNGFYRRKWLAAGLKDPAELRTWDDFARLPFTTKPELMHDQAAAPPFGTNLTYPLGRYVRLHQTSGTTGAPLRWLDTLESWDWWARLWCHVYAGAGVGPADRIFFAFSFGPFVGFWSAFAGARKLGALAITAGGQDSLTRLRAIQEARPTVFLSTPSYALHLAEVAAEQGVDLSASTVRVTIHAGEPGANIPATRRAIEAAWGARAYDHTGATEVGATGFSCSAGQGTHLTESEFICEVIDPETGRSVAPGEQGELVITNLGRPGMPIIRYRTRDLVQLTEAACACGRTFARMVGGIIGRADDMITVRGINVFPSAVEGVVGDFAEVAEFQIEVYKVKAMDDLRVKVELQPDLGEAATEACLRRLADELRARLAIRIEITAAPPGSLPRYEMKAKRLVRVSS